LRHLSVAAAVVVSAFALTRTAWAADIPTRVLVDKTPVAVAPSWTGLYVGGGVGYGMYNLDTIWLLPTGAPFQPLTQTQGGRGWLGTVTVGYDYQFNDNIVAGVFTDYDFASIKGTIQDQAPFTVGTITERSAWAIGARAGWLVTPQVLPYVNGGYTQAHFSSVNMVSNAIVPPVQPPVGTLVSTIPSQAYSGWFVGGGVEANFAPGWFWRNEYRYASYASKTLQDTCAIPTFCGGPLVDLVSIHPYVQTVRSEIIYKFNSGGQSNTYSPPPPMAAFSWTGLYVGGGVDYGMYNADTIWLRASGAPFQPLTQTQGGRGWLGTVAVGYDYQFNNNIVAGVLADYDLASIKGTIQDQNPFTVGTMTEHSAWAIGARAGWLVTPHVLPYANGGYTQAHFSSVNMVSNAFAVPLQPPVGTVISTIPSQTYSGWFIGGGVETKLPWFGDGWFTRTEYRYASYGGKTLPDTCVQQAFCVATGAPISPMDRVSISPYVQTVRSEIIYKFNWGR